MSNSLLVDNTGANVWLADAHSNFGITGRVGANLNQNAFHSHLLRLFSRHVLVWCRWNRQCRQSVILRKLSYTRLQTEVFNSDYWSSFLSFKLNHILVSCSFLCSQLGYLEVSLYFVTSSLVCDRTILSAGPFNYSMMWQPLDTCTYLCVWPAISVTLQWPFAQLRFKFRLSLNMSFHTAGTLRGTPRKWYKRNKFALVIVTCWTHCFTKTKHLEVSFASWMFHPRSLTNVCFFTFGLPQFIFGRNTAPCFTHLKQNSDNKLPVIHWLHIWPLQCVVRYRFVSDWGLKDFFIQ